jgi:putative aldouronate transport system substrate-binding protein
LGFEIKDQYTIQEFTAMVETFMDRGSSLPGVTRGKVDTWSINTWFVVQSFIEHQWIDATGFYKDASGKYVWGPDDPRTFALVQNMKAAIDKGIVSRNFASFTNQEEDDFFYTGQAFATGTNGWVGHVYTDWRKFQDSTGLDPFECIQETTIVDADGYYQGYESLNFFSALFFNPDMDDAKMTRLLKILDYVASPEGQSYIRMGFEGKDYTKNGDTITITREKDASGNFVEMYDKYPGSGLYSHMTICADNYEVTNPAIPMGYHNAVRTMYATRQKLGVDTGTLKDYNWELYFFEGPNYLKFNSDAGSELIRVSMENGDLKTNYDRWLREMRPMVDPVLAELNAAYGK